MTYSVASGFSASGRAVLANFTPRGRRTTSARSQAQSQARTLQAQAVGQSGTAVRRPMGPITAAEAAAAPSVARAPFTSVAAAERAFGAGQGTYNVYRNQQAAYARRQASSNPILRSLIEQGGAPRDVRQGVTVNPASLTGAQAPSAVRPDFGGLANRQIEAITNPGRSGIKGLGRLPPSLPSLGVSFAPGYNERPSTSFLQQVFGAPRSQIEAIQAGQDEARVRALNYQFLLALGVGRGTAGGSLVDQERAFQNVLGESSPVLSQAQIDAAGQPASILQPQSSVVAPAAPADTTTQATVNPFPNYDERTGGFTGFLRLVGVTALSVVPVPATQRYRDEVKSNLFVENQRQMEEGRPAWVGGVFDSLAPATTKEAGVNLALDLGLGLGGAGLARLWRGGARAARGAAAAGDATTAAAKAGRRILPRLAAAGIVGTGLAAGGYYGYQAVKPEPEPTPRFLSFTYNPTPMVTPNVSPQEAAIIDAVTSGGDVDAAYAAYSAANYGQPNTVLLGEDGTTYPYNPETGGYGPTPPKYVDPSLGGAGFPFGGMFADLSPAAKVGLGAAAVLGGLLLMDKTKKPKKRKRSK